MKPSHRTVGTGLKEVCGALGIGHMVAKRQGLEGWGKGLLRRLAVDLKNEIPEIRGFSERNLQLMIQFQREYPDLFAIPQRPVAELPHGASDKEIDSLVCGLDIHHKS